AGSFDPSDDALAGGFPPEAEVAVFLQVFPGGGDGPVQVFDPLAAAAVLVGAAPLGGVLPLGAVGLVLDLGVLFGVPALDAAVEGPEQGSAAGLGQVVIVLHPGPGLLEDGDGLGGVFQADLVGLSQGDGNLGFEFLGGDLDFAPHPVGLTVVAVPAALGAGDV